MHSNGIIIFSITYRFRFFNNIIFLFTHTNFCVGNAPFEAQGAWSICLRKQNKKKQKKIFFFFARLKMVGPIDCIRNFYLLKCLKEPFGHPVVKEKFPRQVFHIHQYIRHQRSVGRLLNDTF